MASKAQNPDVLTQTEASVHQTQKTQREFYAEVYVGGHVSRKTYKFWMATSDGQARKAIKSLLDIKPKHSKVGGKSKKVKVEKK